MSTVSTAFCSSFNAHLGDEVDFTGVVGNQSISAVPGSTWPFTSGPPISFPLPSNSKIYIKSSGLTIGQSYPYIPSNCAAEAQKSVTITGMAEHKGKK